MDCKIIKTKNTENELIKLLSSFKFDHLFFLTDDNTIKHCLSLFSKLYENYTFKTICIKSGDQNKNLETLDYILNYFVENKASRNSLLINLGGGMVTDLGGFSSSIFKRGFNYINIPTTLLGMVDAAVGGKTGINYKGLKNEIGNFALPSFVILDSMFLNTLPHKEFLSGYAEIIKHSILINDKENLEKTLSTIKTNFDEKDELDELIYKSVLIKQKIVEEDPFEKGIRKSLNLGHTFGHAFESYSYEINRPISHGFAVAWGIVAELFLSQLYCNFPKDIFTKIVEVISKNYTGFSFDKEDYTKLYDLMKHDKKNVSTNINFTLMKNIGEPMLDQTPDKEEINVALDFIKDTLCS